MPPFWPGQKAVGQKKKQVVILATGRFYLFLFHLSEGMRHDDKFAGSLDRDSSGVFGGRSSGIVLPQK